MCISEKYTMRLTIANQEEHLRYIVFHFKHLGGSRLKSVAERVSCNLA